MNQSLQIEMKQDKTNWRVFPLVFALVFFLLLFFGGLLSFAVLDKFLPSFGLFNQMLILALAVALGVSAGNKIKEISVVHETLSQDELHKMTADVIKSAGFTCYKGNQKCTFRNSRKVHRLFRDWLGTELIILVQEGKGVSITGPGLYLNQLELKLENSMSRIKAKQESEK